METKHKTLAECKDEVARKHGHATFNRVRFAGTEAQLKIMDEAAELYAGQTKKKEIEALQKFKDYVHKRLDDAGIEKEPNGEHSKAGCRIGDRLDIVLKQSSPVSLEVEQMVSDYLHKELQTDNGDWAEWTESFVWKMVKDLFQSKHPASVAWLTNEEIRSIAMDLSEKYRCGFGLTCEVFRIVQSELRKRVIDPVEFTEWFINNRYTFDSQLGKFFSESYINSGCLKSELLQIYINSKTK